MYNLAAVFLILSPFLLIATGVAAIESKKVIYPILTAVTGFLMLVTGCYFLEKAAYIESLKGNKPYEMEIRYERKAHHYMPNRGDTVSFESYVEADTVYVRKSKNQ